MQLIDSVSSVAVVSARRGGDRVEERSRGRTIEVISNFISSRSVRCGCGALIIIGNIHLAFTQSHINLLLPLPDWSQIQIRIQVPLQRPPRCRLSTPSLRLSTRRVPQQRERIPHPINR